MLSASVLSFFPSAPLAPSEHWALSTEHFFSSSAFSQCRITFSVITIAASTSTPMAMAMPASDMMFDVMPKCRMSTNEIRIETGSGNVTMSTLRK